jgi:hypothetical protein
MAARQTRKHFEAHAETIRTSGLSTSERRRLAEHTANYLATTNPQFSRERFVEWATRSA